MDIFLGNRRKKQLINKETRNSAHQLYNNTLSSIACFVILCSGKRWLNAYVRLRLSVGADEKKKDFPMDNIVFVYIMQSADAFLQHFNIGGACRTP